MTNDIIKLLYKRDYIKRKADVLNCDKLYDEYKFLRNQITCKIREAKAAYFENEYTKTSGDPKKQAKILKILQNKNVKTAIPHELTSTCFNSFFADIGHKTKQKLYTKNQEYKWPHKKVLNKFLFEMVDSSLVLKHLRKLGVTTSSNDVLNMDSKLICIAAEAITPIITTFINASLKLGIVLNDWKLSRVTPIYKGKGDKMDKNNYRPISVIGHLSKILEKIVQSQLVKYLVDNDLISIAQSAYRKFHSTQTAVHNVIEDWLDNISDKLFTAVCLLDISKCFDTIDHKILLNKLQQYGICDVEHKWFNSYLNERSQVVYCNNTLSQPRDITIGVPQGSVLGPILFMIFSNDLPNNVHLGMCNMYADDTLVYIHGDSVTDAQHKLQKCVDSAVKWYETNNLVINAKKSNTMVISKNYISDQSNDMSISICDEKIENVEEALYLGIKIDNKMSWTPHVNKLCKSLGYNISRLKQIRKFCNKQMLCSIYNSTIQPIIDYGITIWSLGMQKHMHRIQRLQNQCARTILNNFDFKNMRGIDLVKELGWMTVQERANYFMALMVFKSLKGINPHYLQNLFDLRKDLNLRSNTKTEYDIYIPPFETSVKDRSFSIHGARLWNNLPLHLKRIQTLWSFKREYKKYFNL
jgi:hypothetical protein